MHRKLPYAIKYILFNIQPDYSKTAKQQSINEQKLQYLCTYALVYFIDMSVENINLLVVQYSAIFSILKVL